MGKNRSFGGLCFCRFAPFLLNIAIMLHLVGCNIPSGNRIKTRYWVNDPTLPGALFPEQSETNVWNDLAGKEDLGVCFSGGGTRSATATVGQLRALEQLKLLNKVRYISAVSGGAWTAIPFTYIPKPNTSESFLGEYVPPAKLSVCNLNTCRGSMLHAISESLVVGGGLGQIAVGRGSESYSRVIAKTFLKEFGLDHSEKWFTWNDATASSVIERNPVMKSEGNNKGYFVVAPERPFLIVGGTIRHYGMPASLIPFRWNTDTAKRVPIEYTPLYCGVRPFVPIGRYNEEPIGGGYVESFAFDSIRPRKVSDSLAEVQYYRRLPWRNEPFLNLGDIMGSTGAAPGEFSSVVELFGFPKFEHWSPEALKTQDQSRSMRYSFQDGGLSENLGITPLLARRVKKIIAFINAEDEVVVGNGQSLFPDYVKGLFGKSDAGFYKDTQVFPSDKLDEIGNQLAEKIRQKRSALVCTPLRTLANSRFGISPYDVEICWVFLDARLGTERLSASKNWLYAMGENSVVRKKIETEKEFKRFPRYHTFFEDRPLLLWDVIRLKQEKSTALAHYTSWVVVSEHDEMKQFLSQ